MAKMSVVEVFEEPPERDVVQVTLFGELGDLEMVRAEPRRGL